jgi:transmembrane sensor
MKDYRLYEVVDFVSDEDFIHWVYNENEEDKLFWEKWLSENPGKHLAVAEARRLLYSISVTRVPVSDIEIQQEKQKFLATIKKPDETTIQKRVIKMWFKYAAVVLVLLSATAGFILYKKTKTSNSVAEYSYASLTASKQNLIEQINTSLQPSKISLPDGSTVILSPGSRFSYDAGIDTASLRNVYLSGEAFFEIAKNAKKPFRVFANEIVTKVLGTSFNVRSFENDKSIIVTVRTGKVSVSRGNENATGAKEAQLIAQPGGVLLTPNQQAVYVRNENKIKKILVEKPVIINSDIKQGNFIYDDAPVVNVVEQLKKAYGIDILYDKDVLKKCTITADLTDESLYRKMDLLCKAIGAVYEITEAEIIIQSKGCDD